MNPFLKAIQVYETETSARSFNQDLSWHLEHGFVFSRPDFFIMGRPVPRDASPHLITALHKFHSDACDCWHVYLLGGNIAPSIKILPWPMEWVSFERNNKLRFHRLANIDRVLGDYLTRTDHETT